MPIVKLFAFIGLIAFAGCKTSNQLARSLSPGPRHLSDIAGDWVSFSNGNAYRLTITELGAGSIIDTSGNHCTFWKARMLVPAGYELLIDKNQSNSLQLTKIIAFPSLKFMNVEFNAKRYSGEAQFWRITNVVNQMLKLEIR